MAQSGDKLNTADRADELARRILALSRSTLLVEMRYMDEALSAFELKQYPGAIATDGATLYYDPFHVIADYKAEPNRCTRDYLHLVLHCVFHHPFPGPGLDRRRWDAACDIAAESVIGELDLESVSCEREERQRETLSALRDEIGALTAEKIYRRLLDQKLSDNQVAALREPFIADDHRSWTMPGADGSGGESRGGGGADGVSARRGGNKKGGGRGKGKGGLPGQKPPEQAWQDISERMKADLETLSAEQGRTARGLIQNLLPVTREKYDYAQFLRAFSALGEVREISDQDFDPIFYTYGLSLYGDLPLIEPLEVRETRRIRQFVIAIDTSGSVAGELVQRFVSKTYDILSSQGSFFSKTDIRILQCDAKIQEDKKISSREELEEYMGSMELRGFGGTDFRPVFEYVEKLRAQGELSDLGGLIYFTDGRGTFPAGPPDYPAAFVFADGGDEEPEVPVWAIRLTLPGGEV